MNNGNILQFPYSPNILSGISPWHYFYVPVQFLVLGGFGKIIEEKQYLFFHTVFFYHIESLPYGCLSLQLKIHIQ